MSSTVPDTPDPAPDLMAMLIEHVENARAHGHIHLGPGITAHLHDRGLTLHLHNQPAVTLTADQARHLAQTITDRIGNP